MQRKGSADDDRAREDRCGHRDVDAFTRRHANGTNVIAHPVVLIPLAGREADGEREVQDATRKAAARINAGAHRGIEASDDEEIGTAWGHHEGRNRFKVDRRRTPRRDGVGREGLSAARTHHPDLRNAGAVASDANREAVDRDILDAGGGIVVAHHTPVGMPTFVLAQRRNLRAKRERAALDNRHDDRRFVGELALKRRLHNDVRPRSDRVLGVDVRVPHHADGEAITQSSVDDGIRGARDAVDVRRATRDHQVDVAEFEAAVHVVRPLGRGDLDAAVIQRAGRDDEVEVALTKAVSHVTDTRQAKPGGVDVAPRIRRHHDVGRGNIERALRGRVRPRLAREANRQAGPAERELIARDDHVVRDRLGRNDRSISRSNRSVREEVSVPSVRDHSKASLGQRRIEAVRNVSREAEPKLVTRTDREAFHVEEHGARVRSRSQFDRTREYAPRPLVDQLHVPEEHVAGRVREEPRSAGRFDSESHVDLEVALGVEGRALEPRVVAPRVDRTGSRPVITDGQDARLDSAGIGRSHIDDTGVRHARVSDAHVGHQDIGRHLGVDDVRIRDTRVARRSVRRSGVHRDLDGRAAGVRIGETIGRACDAGVAAVQNTTSVQADAVCAGAEELSVAAVRRPHGRRRTRLRPVLLTRPPLVEAGVARRAKATLRAAVVFDRAAGADRTRQFADSALSRVVARDRRTRRCGRNRHAAAPHRRQHQNHRHLHLFHHLQLSNVRKNREKKRYHIALPEFQPPNALCIADRTLSVTALKFCS